MGRAPCCDKANVKKGPWSPEEDAKLKAYIEKYGTGGNWIALPQKIGLKRCGKSCRLRWLNYLRPNIKHGGFSEEEDNIICSLYISIGSRWSIIAAQLPGRTDNDIKNYWNTRLKKKLLGRRKQSDSSNGRSDSTHDNQINGCDEGQFSQTLSNSALERLQLHMQLQNFQNPFSFYNNPALWPKLHQQKMVQAFQALNNNENPNFQNFNTLLPNSQTLGLIQPNFAPRVCENEVVVEMEKVNVDPIVNFEQESGYIPPHEVDCFDVVSGGSKDSLVWWANEFDSKSASSNSWDSTLQSSQGMFQDFELDYNM